MLEYIEKERALSIVAQTRKSFESTMGKETDFLSSLNLCGCINATMIIEDSLSDLPAADVVPVVHGKWTPGVPYCPICGKDKFEGLDADIWADWMPPRCPHCGAIMDLED